MGERNTSMSGSLIKGDSKALGVFQRKVLEEANAGRKNFSYGEVVDMLIEWTDRFNDELEDLEEAEKRKTRELEVKLLIDAEKQKLRTGYLAPDLRMNKTVSLMRAWDGSDVGSAKFTLASFKAKPEFFQMDVSE